MISKCMFFINFHVGKFRLFIFRSHLEKVPRIMNGGGGVVEIRKVRIVALELSAHHRNGSAEPPLECADKCSWKHEKGLIL